MDLPSCTSYGGVLAVALPPPTALVRSNDGFEIAEMDLRLRGPGQVLVTRQSGLPDLALASLTDDGEVLEQARRVAQEIVSVDPDLAQHPGLAKVLHDQRHRVAQAARLN